MIDESTIYPPKTIGLSENVRAFSFLFRSSSPATIFAHALQLGQIRLSLLLLIEPHRYIN